MKTTHEYKQHISTDKLLVISCLSVALGLAGCQQEGSAEKAGQKIDRAAEKAERKIDRATTKAEQKIEAAKESLDQKAETAGEYIDGSVDASKGTLEQAGKKLDQATEKAAEKIEGAKELVIDKAETAGEYIDDSVITTQVKAAILNDPMLNASHIEVSTVKGVVTLSGTVDSEASIGRALELANSQKNVESVQSNLIVNAPTPSN
ncbi:MAG: BON domain-containing protein [Methylobacter sp.]|nr:BON domain-containing protein [Methylobacter sp.]MDP2099704.1 BON domain-containing protein [Methylobacter sp.]MDP2430337.1 BON domain-containing protein [Methylobacter sp.]MDP3053506.1 BON domain-containing protein [Methylobacter sp.]MDP3362685.1 BON domain-containing protein [Methylobacter sp.]